MANPDYRIKVHRSANLKEPIEALRCRGLEVRQDSRGNLYAQPTKERDHARFQ